MDEKKWYEKLKELTALKTLLVGIAPIIWLLIDNYVTPHLLPSLPTKSWTTLAICMLLLLTWSLHTLWTKSKLRLIAGVYWDSKKNPYCKKCKVPLGVFSNYVGEPEKSTTNCSACGCVNNIVKDYTSASIDDIKHLL